MYNRLVKNKRLLLTLPLLLAAAIFVVPSTVPRAHAATGLVCIVFPSTSTTCPAGSPSYGPVSVGQNITVGVFISGSDAMGGLDIYVKSDPAVLAPVSAALGPLIVSPSLTSICINGAATTGACTVGTANGAGVVEVTTIESTGTNECGGISPCSGLAFTITYHAVSAATTTLTYPSAAGCANTSVTGTTNCVLVATATGTTLSENIQTPAATVTVVTQMVLHGVCIVYPSTTASCPSDPRYGPFSVGQNFTVGVFIQNSQPIGGFDIYVKVDSNFLHPIGVMLGPAITNPTLTNICINGVSVIGTCTVNTANGPDVVECSTIEGSGLNDPGTGLLCKITYLVVHSTPSTPIFYPSAPGCANTSVTGTTQCVLVADNLGTTLVEAAQGAMILIPHVVDPTNPILFCASPAVVGTPTKCTVEIDDTASFGQIFSVGGVKWSTDGFGTFSSFTCTLQPVGLSAISNCMTFYTPLGVGIGITHIFVIYDPNNPPTAFDVKDPTHSGSTGSTTLTVLPATPSISTTVIIDQTGQPVPPGGSVPLGLSVHGNALLFGGYPVTGVAGTVTYTLFPNGGCTGTGIFSSTVTVRASNDVPSSTPSFTPNATGSYSINARYQPGTTDNNAVTSACEPFTVGVVLAPSFTTGKLHWSHHLSLSKSNNTQTWTALVANPLLAPVNVLVRIVGSSAINPSLTFDVVCGATTCINTPVGFGRISTPGLNPQLVPANNDSFTFSPSQFIPSSFANNEFAFTATLYWTSTTGTIYAATNSMKSGSFTVVP